jgi:hypothetical protein
MKRRRPGAVPWFSAFLIVTTLAVETATHFDRALFDTLQAQFALDWEALERFQFYRLATSPFLQTSPGYSQTIIGLTAFTLPIFELRTSTLRTTLTFLAGDWLSTVPILVALKLAGLAGNDVAARLASQPDSGSSSGGFACLGALCLSLPFRLRLAGLGGLAAFFAIRLAYWHRLFDFQHALATLLGIAAWLAWDRRRRLPSIRPWSRGSSVVRAN